MRPLKKSPTNETTVAIEADISSQVYGSIKWARKIAAENENVAVASLRIGSYRDAVYPYYTQDTQAFQHC